MKRTFKQCCSTIHRCQQSHLTFTHWTKTTYLTYDGGNPGLKVIAIIDMVLIIYYSRLMFDSARLTLPIYCHVIHGELRY